MLLLGADNAARGEAVEGGDGEGYIRRRGSMIPRKKEVTSHALINEFIHVFQHQSARLGSELLLFCLFDLADGDRRRGRACCSMNGRLSRGMHAMCACNMVICCSMNGRLSRGRELIYSTYNIELYSARLLCCMQSSAYACMHASCPIPLHSFPYLFISLFIYFPIYLFIYLLSI